MTCNICQVTVQCHAQVNKHKLFEDLGVPYRDLRMLDPMVSRS